MKHFYFLGSFVNCFLLCFLMGLVSFSANADNMRPSSLTLTATGEQQFNVVWKVPAIGKMSIPLNVAFDDDAQMQTIKSAQYFAGANIQKWAMIRKQGLIGLTINIEGLAVTDSDVLLRIIDRKGEVTTAVLNTDKSRYVIEEKLKATHTISTYIILGIEHILIGLDHLLFVACLVFISSSRKKLFYTITGFTLAHSITLFMAATGVVLLPIAPVEAIIALSIVFLAVEIAKQRKNSFSLKYPVAVSSSFGLLHGFGFASVLADIGLPEEEKLTALLGFNLGVEIGQLLFVAVLFFLYRLYLLVKPNLQLSDLARPVSYFSGSVAMVWLLSRLSAF